MIYTQQSHLPIIFQVDEGIIVDIKYYLRRNKLHFTNVLLVSGASNSLQYAKQIKEKTNWNNYILKGNTLTDVEALKEYANSNRVDLIIGVGGGKVIDTVKRVSYLSNINNLSIPTIISNDGLISPVAVIKDEQGRTQSLPGMMPMGVIIDLEIIKESPNSFLKAAIGDVFSNLSATNDWILAFQNGSERMNDIAFHLSKSAAGTLLHFKDINLKNKPFLRLLVQGLVNSGIAMSLAGTSRPCSGSEHLISHAIDYLGLSSRHLHGEQVASASLFTLFIQNKLKPIHIDFAKRIDFPLNFATLLSQYSEQTFFEIMDKAREMRPGRYTVLNDLSSNELYEKYLLFQGKITGQN